MNEPCDPRQSPRRRLTTTQAVRSAPIVLSRTATAAIAATFFLMGALIAAYGPLLEHLTRRFGVDLPVAGSVISVHFAGGLCGVLVAMQTLQRRDGRQTLMPALGLAAAGCVVVAIAPAWPVLLAGVFVIGVGFGGLVIALNQLAAYSAGPRRAGLLNALNAAYSAGAVAGPVVVAGFAASHFSAIYLAFAALTIAIIPAAAGVRGRLPGAGGATGGPSLLVLAFVFAFVFYVGIENGTGGWMTSHLESTGVASVEAATLTSGFWLAVLAGRLAIASIPADVSERTVVLASAAAATACLAATALPAAAPVAYIAAGLAMAPIFPTAIVWLARLRPDDARTTAWLFPATSVGGIAGPGAIGIVVGAFGVAWVPAVLAGVALAMASSFFIASRSAGR
jgi:MFS transporter, FHS family, glucose/mannose:H+ symporter